MSGISEWINDAATAATGAATIGNEDAQYTWDGAQRKVVVQNHPSTADYLYVRYNAATASAASWDVVLSPGDIVVSPDGLLISSLAVFSTGDLTYNTHYAIRGWD